MWLHESHMRRNLLCNCVRQCARPSWFVWMQKVTKEDTPTSLRPSLRRIKKKNQLQHFWCVFCVSREIFVCTRVVYAHLRVHVTCFFCVFAHECACVWVQACVCVHWSVSASVHVCESISTCVLTAALASVILAFFSLVLAASKSRRFTWSSFRSF